MAYKSPNPITKIKISDEPDCVPSESNEINFSSGANVSLSTDPDTNTITISSSAGPTNLPDLNDVEILNPQNGETLTYDFGTGKWVNSAPTTSVAADDISVGDDSVLITTTSGTTTLSSQDGDVNIVSNENIRIDSENESVFIDGYESVWIDSQDSDINISSGAVLDIDAASDITMNASGGILVQSGSNMMFSSSAAPMSFGSSIFAVAATDDVTIRSETEIKLDSRNSLILDSRDGVWDFHESGVSQLRISTDPSGNDIKIRGTNPFGEVYLSIDAPTDADSSSITNCVEYRLRGSAATGYHPNVGINFQEPSLAPVNLLDILATDNNQGFIVSMPKTPPLTGKRPLISFTRENNEYGRLVLYDQSSTASSIGATQIGTRPGMHHYFQSIWDPSLTQSYFGIGTGPAVDTLFHIASEREPYITIQNLTDEHTDGGCETQIRFSDHDLNILGQIEGSHDGAADDHKGKLKLLVNDGTTLLDALVVGHEGDIKKIGQSVPANGNVLTWDNPNTRAVWSAPAGGGGLTLTTDTATLTHLTPGGTTTIWADLVSLGLPGAGFSNGIMWNTGINIPAGAVVSEVGFIVAAAFDNMAVYDTVVSWLPDTTVSSPHPLAGAGVEEHSWVFAELLLGFSGFYDSGGYFSAYYGSKVLGSVGTSSTNVTWENDTGGAIDLKIAIHHEMNWGTLTAPSAGSATVFVKYWS